MEKNIITGKEDLNNFMKCLIGMNSDYEEIIKFIYEAAIADLDFTICEDEIECVFGWAKHEMIRTIRNMKL